jgi:hypothetical protein
MLDFLAKWFGSNSRKKSKPAQRRRQARIGVEELMPRILPSAGPLAMGCGHHGGDDSTSALTASADTAGDSCHHGDHGSHGAAFVASLTSTTTTGETGQAQFNPTTGQLTVRVKGAAANATLDVFIGTSTTPVGTLTTDADGDGKVTLTVPSTTTISGATAITVGDLTGTFAQVEFTAPLTGATGVSGNAKYNSTKNVLHLSLTGAAASTTYNVTINSTVVGTLTTDSTGAGKLKVTPASTVTIAAGSTLTVVLPATGSTPILTGIFA